MQIGTGISNVTPNRVGRRQLLAAVAWQRGQSTERLSLFLLDITRNILGSPLPSRDLEREAKVSWLTSAAQQKPEQSSRLRHRLRLISGICTGENGGEPARKTAGEIWIV